MMDFQEKLSALVALEMSGAHADADRQAIVLERLLHAVSFTIALMAGGDSETTEQLLMGAEAYLSDGAVALSPFGQVMGDRP